MFCFHFAETRMSKEKLLNVKNYGSSGSKYFTGQVMHNFGIEDDHVPFRDRGRSSCVLYNFHFQELNIYMEKYFSKWEISNLKLQMSFYSFLWLELLLYFFGI